MYSRMIGNKIYYYASRRMGKTVRQDYLGPEWMLEDLLALDQVLREEAAEDRKALDESRAALDAAKQAAREAMGAGRAALDAARERFTRVDAHCGDLRDTADDLMASCGFQRHSRGPWRRKRTMTMKATNSAATERPTAPADQETTQRTSFETSVASLMDLVDGGSEVARRGFRETLEKSPGIAKFFADHTRRSVIQSILAPLGLKTSDLEGRLAGYELLRSDLGGIDPTPIELLLVDRLVLYVAEADVAAEQARRSKQFESGYEALRERAERRLQSATKSLVAVRRVNVEIHLHREVAEAKKANLRIADVG